MSILEAKHSWSGTAGLASASQLVNGTIVRQVVSPSHATGNLVTRLRVFFSARPADNLSQSETIKTRPIRRGKRMFAKPRKSKNK